MAKKSVSDGKVAPTLIGKCFVIYREDDSTAPSKIKIDRQGHIVAEVAEGHYLVQFFDWIIGQPSTMVIVPIAAMRANPHDVRVHGGWEFFEDDEHMRFWMDNTGRQYR